LGYSLVEDNEVPAESSSEPIFLAPIKNISVPVGKEAVLHCVVDNLGQYKVFALYILA
jgi:hypothetical protein